jgi:exonuclease V gamma subunit
MKIFVSNCLEVLAQSLKKELFQGQGHPFAKRWVVVPSERIKQDLFLRWSSDPLLQVSTGIKMITWSEALRRLFPHLPSQAELSLKIEAALEHGIPEPLLSYLAHGGRQRKISLCDKMSTLFLYYLAQSEEKLLQWLAKEGWQQSLWSLVLGPEIKTQISLDGKVYLFHPSELSPSQLDVFKKMNASCFLFSPCAMYWGDLRTFCEQRFLIGKAESQAKELSRYFEEEHPLLANWGRQGRQLLGLFEDEAWEDGYEVTSGNSLLQTIQGEMLSLSRNEKIQDDSIQIHSAPSKLREVEVVWEIIQRLPYEPNEILVLAPDMQEYAATVELVFRQRGGPFDFAVFCLEARSKSPLMQGLEDLLDLPRYRYSKEAVEKLLFCPSFLNRFGFEIADAHLLQKWMSRVNVRYDLNADHPGSWKAGLKRLIEALVATAKDDHITIEFSQADLLSRWITAVRLFEELQIIEKAKLSLKEWTKTLRFLVDKFFTPDPDDDLMRALGKFQQMEIEGHFSFSSIERVLKDIFRQKSGAVQGSHLQAVRFASLEKGALLPAKAIILMGMEEGGFPRQDQPSSLNQLPAPSRIEEDKYLFLEALCSARENFILTYTRLHPEDGKSQKTSPLVEELSRYCSHLPITDHPFSPIDPFYFQGKGFQSFSKPYFEMLQQKGQHKERSAQEKAVLQLPSVPLTHIDVHLLKKLARHPLRFFFEERLGLDFEWKEQDGEFVLSYFDMERLRKASLKQPPFQISELLSLLQDEGKLPIGSFGEVAVKKIRDEIKNYHEMLEKLNVKPKEIYSIELKASCRHPTQIDRNWIYPALHINGTVIQGKIDDLCPQGILFHGDESLADQLKVWPLYLIAQNLSLPHPLQILLTKKGKISELKIDFSLQALERYIDYAKKALAMPSPLHPKWARGVFKEGKIPASLGEDSILEWILSRGLLPPEEPWLKSWNPYLQEVFHELL